MKALLFNEFGGSKVLYYGEIDTPIAKADEVLMQAKSIGLNFADVYRRKGNYHLVGKPPYILGYEAAGIITQVGKNVQDYKVGDRIAIADVPLANAEFIAVPDDKIIPLPNSISFEIGAALLLQGLTAYYLTHDSYNIKKTDTILVHAAAGGVGQLITKIAKIKGAKVIGLTSSEEKRQFAKTQGADEVFLYKENWVKLVKENTKHKGVDVVFESVGKTLSDSFEATKICGTVVFFGMAGGDPEPVDPRYLMDTSKTLVGGDLWNYLTSKEERVKRANKLFKLIENGKLSINISQKIQLKDGKKAHDLIESRKSMGKILLIP